MLAPPSRLLGGGAMAGLAPPPLDPLVTLTTRY